MKPEISGPARRFAASAALAIAIWSAVSASTSGVAAPAAAGTANAAIGPGRIYLAQADGGPAERPVSYAPDQADKGAERYAKDCQECHGDDLRGGLNGGPPLRGLAFEEKYADGLPASVLFSFMSTQMPPNSPGRYPASTYADLMAYILKRNGFQPGAPLPSDIDALGNLIVEN